VVSGTCPACKGALQARQPTSVFLGEDAAGDTALADIAHLETETHDVVVWCDCRVAHPGAPEKTTGCGRYYAFTVQVKV
jgi:hypothetical protein